MWVVRLKSQVGFSEFMAGFNRDGVYVLSRPGRSRRVDVEPSIMPAMHWACGYTGRARTGKGIEDDIINVGVEMDDAFRQGEREGVGWPTRSADSGAMSIERACHLLDRANVVCRGRGAR